MLGELRRFWCFVDDYLSYSEAVESIMVSEITIKLPIVF
jgi:hypothetical protein